MMKNAERISIIIPAAGKSSRMGDSDKLLLSLDGNTLLKLAVLKAVNSTAKEVIVVLRQDQLFRLKEIEDFPVKIVYSTHQLNLMSNSIQAGLDRVEPSALGVLIFLPDMPLITTSDLNTLIDCFHEEHIVQACNHNQQPGHPVLFPRQILSNSFKISGDEGLRTLLQANASSVYFVPLEGNRALVDVDTPDDWKKLTGAGEGT